MKTKALRKELTEALRQAKPGLSKKKAVKESKKMIREAVATVTPTPKQLRKLDADELASRIYRAG